MIELCTLYCLDMIYIYVCIYISKNIYYVRHLHPFSTL